MTIKYKFNKSSEARDCVVESVELEISRVNKTNITEAELYSLNDKFDDDYQRFISKKLNCDLSNINKGITTTKVELDLSTKDFTIKGIAVHILTHQDNYCKDIVLWKEIKTKETKTLTSPQQLKDHINTIQEPIEFIAESSIDDVLMKEWIGEWEYKYIREYTDNAEIRQGTACDMYYDVCDDIEIIDGYILRKTYIGSPELNLNWTFKILN